VSIAQQEQQQENQNKKWEWGYENEGEGTNDLEGEAFYTCARSFPGKLSVDISKFYLN